MAIAIPVKTPSNEDASLNVLRRDGQKADAQRPSFAARPPQWVRVADRAIRTVLRKKMGVRLPSLAVANTIGRPQNPGSPEVEEALDMYGDAITDIARHFAAGREIGDVRRYAEQVAYRVFSASLRTRYHNRYQIRLRIYHVLSGRSRATGLTMWTSGDMERLCGFQQWRDEGRHQDHSWRLLQHGVGDRWRRHFIWHALGGREPQEITLDGLLAIIFDSAGGPVEFESLISIVACLLQTSEPRRAMRSYSNEGSDEGLSAVSPEKIAEAESTDPLRRTIDRDTLVWACSEIPQLPRNQRLALLLPLQADLLRLLTGIGRVRAVSHLLGCDQAETVAMLGAVPLDDNEIACRLALSRQQVINLRSAARRRLARRYVMGTGSEEGIP